MQLILQHCCKRVEKRCCRCCLFYHPLTKPVLQQLGCCRLGKELLKKAESSSTFCNKPLHVARFTGQGKLILQRVTQSCLCPDSRVILSNQLSVFTQFATAWFVARQVWTWVIKRATSSSTPSVVMFHNKLLVLVAPFTVALFTLTTHMISSLWTQDYSWMDLEKLDPEWNSDWSFVWTPV